MKILKDRKDDVLKVILFSIVIIWLLCFVIDYARAIQNKWPLFCVKETFKEYEDGTVKLCTGVGYKLYKYDRNSIPVTVQFGPFFIKERTK